MATRHIPIWTRHAPTPGVRGFAILQGFEAVTRGMLISVFPLEMYRALGDASVVSQFYFMVGLISLFAGLMIPWIARFIPRRWLYTIGVLLYVFGALVAIIGGTAFTPVALLANTIATVSESLVPPEQSLQVALILDGVYKSQATAREVVIEY